MNLAEQSYYFYYLDLDRYVGEEKTKKIEQIFFHFPFTIFFSLLFFILIFIYYIYIILYLYNIEQNFINILIDNNSPKFDIYFKKLEEIKKLLINDINNDNNNNINNKEDEIKNDNINPINTFKKSIL